MGGQLTTGSSIYMASAGVPAADGAGLSSIKSFSQLLTSIAALPLAGGTLTGNLLFSADNTYTIGATGANRPSAVHAGTGGVKSAGRVDVGITGDYQIQLLRSGNIACYIGQDSNRDFRIFDASGVVAFQINTTSGTANKNATLYGGMTVLGLVKMAVYTVATLPSAASNAYYEACVSDSNAAASGNYGATVVGGGSNKVKVFSDGINWVIA